MDVELADGVPGTDDHLVDHVVERDRFAALRDQFHQGLQPIKLIAIRGILHHPGEALYVQRILVFSVDHQTVSGYRRLSLLHFTSPRLKVDLKYYFFTLSVYHVFAVKSTQRIVGTSAPDAEKKCNPKLTLDYTDYYFVTTSCISSSRTTRVPPE